MEIKKVGFVYTVEIYGADKKLQSRSVETNIIPDVGVDYLLNAGFKGGTQYTSFYLSLFENNYTPVAGDTMTTLLASCGENTTYTTTGTNRIAITFPAVSGGVLSTVASPNEVEFINAATIRGAFITTNITRGSTAGLLISAALFSAVKSIDAGGSLKVPLGFALVAV